MLLTEFRNPGLQLSLPVCLFIILFIIIPEVWWEIKSQSISEGQTSPIEAFWGSITNGHTDKLATVMKADNIIVLGHGEILEQGTHQELLERNGAYATLVNVSFSFLDLVEFQRNFWSSRLFSCVPKTPGYSRGQ